MKPSPCIYCKLKPTVHEGVGWHNEAVYMVQCSNGCYTTNLEKIRPNQAFPDRNRIKAIKIWNGLQKALISKDKIKNKK